MRRRIAFVISAALVAFGASACMDKATEQFQDAGRTKVTDMTPADDIAMPDGVTNVFSKCVYKGDRLFVAFHADGSYASIFVVPNDTSC